MDLSAKHAAARLAAQRLPALHASLALLTRSSQAATIALYGTPRPVPGDPPGGAALATLALATAAGGVDEERFQIVLETPIEGRVSGADPATGTEALWARVTDGAGDWWGDGSVSESGGAGELQFDTTRLLQGATVRLISGLFQG